MKTEMKDWLLQHPRLTLFLIILSLVSFGFIIGEIHGIWTTGTNIEQHLYENFDYAAKNNITFSIHDNLYRIEKLNESTMIDLYWQNITKK